LPHTFLSPSRRSGASRFEKLGQGLGSLDARNKRGSKGAAGAHRENYSESTIRTYGATLKTLLKRKVNLLDPEAVKEYLAKIKRSQAHKHVVTAAYTLFLKMQGLSWDPPRYRLNRKLPFIPTEKELDVLIAAAGKKWLHSCKH